jgi:hypothetical protein
MDSIFLQTASISSLVAWDFIMTNIAMPPSLLPDSKTGFELENKGFADFGA